MARGMWRGAATAWGALIVLQAITTKRGAGAVGGMFGAVDDLVKRALDPSVPAIPDHSAAASTSTTDSDGNVHPNIPGYLGGGTTTAPGSGKNSNPKFHVVDPPPRGQHNPAYDNPSNQPGGIPELYLPGIPSTTTTTA